MLRRTVTVVLLRRAQAPLARHGRQSSTRRELSFAEELMQHRKTQGKTIVARREDGAVAFPTFDAVDVDGTPWPFPALLSAASRWWACRSGPSARRSRGSGSSRLVDEFT